MNKIELTSELNISVDISKEQEVIQVLKTWNQELPKVIAYLLEYNEMEIHYGKVENGGFIEYERDSTDDFDGIDSEHLFYETALKYPAAKLLVSEFINTILKTVETEDDVWLNCETPMGFYQNYFLALAYEDSIPLFAKYINTIDMDHTPIEDFGVMLKKLRNKWGTKHKEIEALVKKFYTVLLEEDFPDINPED